MNYCNSFFSNVLRSELDSRGFTGRGNEQGGEGGNGGVGGVQEEGGQEDGDKEARQEGEADEPMGEEEPGRRRCCGSRVVSTDASKMEEERERRRKMSSWSKGKV